MFWTATSDRHPTGLGSPLGSEAEPCAPWAQRRLMPGGMDVPSPASFLMASLANVPFEVLCLQGRDEVPYKQPGNTEYSLLLAHAGL